MARPLRVLLVEDNPYDAELILLKLRRAQFAPEWKCVETEEAFLENLRPDLDIILSDHSMPSFSGPRALALLQQRGWDIPFIIISGTIGEEVAVEVMRLGATDYLLKDRLARLGIAVGHALEQSRLRKESRKTAERLHEQASLLDRARDAIVVRDLAHGITYWNKGAERIYGWTAEEAVGRKISELLYRDTGSFEEATACVVKNGEWHGELQQLNKAGGQLLVEARWTLVSDGTGQPQSILAINTDITEKKKLEQQFLRAQRLESIGTLAGGIAHDLNNVLAPILMSIELLRLTSQDERAQSMLATIEASAKRGGDMVRQILSFARGADGRRAVMDIRHIIKDIHHLAQETFPKNIRFQCDMAANLPPIVGDHTQVHQVLLNLCVNARDSMPGGGVLTLSAAGFIVDEFLAAMHPNARPGPHVLIKVADTGTGIPADVIDKIFDPFFTTKEVGKGTGLGLSTALAIVKSHGGFLEVDSESGHGAAFSIYLPAQAPLEESKTAAAENRYPQGRGELILIVDDEAAVRTITSQTLEAFGYRAMVAADGTEALSLYTEHQSEIAAVVTDLMMPVMDGAVTIQVLQRINPDVKVIAGSGLPTNGPASRMADLGVNHFLAKPYTAQAVLTALHELLHDDA